MEWLFFPLLFCMAAFTVGADDIYNPNGCYKSGNQARAMQAAPQFCKKFNLIYREETTDYRDLMMNAEYTACSNEIIKYFEFFNTTTFAIDKYCEVCGKMHKLDCVYCAKVINHLKTYCYSMSAAADLLKNLDPKIYLSKLNGYKAIVLKAEDYDHLGFNGFVIERCLPMFTDDQTVKNRRAEIKKYVEWYTQSITTGCQCTAIFGLSAILKAREGGIDNKEAYNTLFKAMCNDLTPAEYHNLNQWKSQQFEAVAKEAKGHDIAVIRKFFMEGSYISESTWMMGDNHTTEWSFNEIVEFVKFGEAGYQTRIELVAAAVMAKYTKKNYESFNQMLEYSNQLHKVPCQAETLSSFFNPKLHAVRKMGRQYPNEKFWATPAKEDFMEVFKNMLKMYDLSEEPDHCPIFIKNMERVQDTIYESRWQFADVKELVKVAAEKEKDFTFFIDCLKYSLKFEQFVINENILPAPKSTDGKVIHASEHYRSQFAHFRKSLFSLDDKAQELCQSKMANHELEKGKIMNIAGYVFKLSDGEKSGNLETVFKNLPATTNAQK